MISAHDPELMQFVAAWEEALAARTRPEVIAECFEREAKALLNGRIGDARQAAETEVARLRRELCLL